MLACTEVMSPMQTKMNKPVPIRERVVKRLPQLRIPETEAHTPRLRSEKRTIDAIGFTADLGGYDDAD
jgi:hypothetical protein